MKTIEQIREELETLEQEYRSHPDMRTAKGKWLYYRIAALKWVLA